ncbi:MAG TPA: nitroreductase family deazaflavin-dependent oxidoreductase [Mycobacteriales bacterium]|nr:nitroreductase family deazaflavin-dependent oxidoreductase [Mycobacteriales bacterium]
MPLFSVEGRVGRTVQKIAGSRRFAPVAKHVVPRIDKGLNRLTGGRFVLSSLLVPSLVLTAKGAKSGQPRTTPLACMPEDDGGWVVVGSNFGQTKHPAWTANLLAHPDATVNVRGREVPVRARLLEGEERAATWARITKVWPTYDRYVELSGGRDIRVFRLDPKA